MRALWLAAAIVFSCFCEAAPAQTLAPTAQQVWPKEFAEPSLSCQKLAASTPGYLATPRPKFNCTKGVDCPSDLEPTESPAVEFKIYYDYGAKSLNPTINSWGVETLKVTIGRLLKDMDAVMRSARRQIVVSAYTDTSGTAKENQEISERIGECIANAINVSVHLNGYQGAYDFPLTTKAYGETYLDKATADGVREPLNRRAGVIIIY